MKEKKEQCVGNMSIKNFQMYEYSSINVNVFCYVIFVST